MSFERGSGMMAVDQALTLRKMLEAGLMPEATHQKTRVISITGGKGGVGKSTVAANLAVHYGTRRSKVLVLDADLGMADLNLLLGVAPDKNLLDVLEGEDPQRVLTEAHGIHLLPACNASTKLANITDAQRAMLLSSIDVLEHRFDTLIVDCAAGIASNSVGFAAAAMDIIAVVTPDPTSLADAYACLKVLSREYSVKRMYVLPNNVRSQVEADGVIQRMTMLASRFLDLSLIPLPAIPYDPAVRSAGAAGIPFVLHVPDSAASRAVAQVARRLDGDSFGDDRAGAIRLFWRRALSRESLGGGGDKVIPLRGRVKSFKGEDDES